MNSPFAASRSCGPNRVIAKLRLPRYYQAMLNSVNRPQNKGLLNEIRSEAKKCSFAPVMAVKRIDSSSSNRRLINRAWILRQR